MPQQPSVIVTMEPPHPGAVDHGAEIMRLKLQCTQYDKELMDSQMKTTQAMTIMNRVQGQVAEKETEACRMRMQAAEKEMQAAEKQKEVLLLKMELLLLERGQRTAPDGIIPSKWWGDKDLYNSPVPSFANINKHTKLRSETSYGDIATSFSPNTSFADTSDEGFSQMGHSIETFAAGNMNTDPGFNYNGNGNPNNCGHVLDPGNNSEPSNH